LDTAEDRLFDDALPAELKVGVVGLLLLLLLLLPSAMPPLLLHPAVVDTS
jgi:hypothetical protein